MPIEYPSIDRIQAHFDNCQFLDVARMVLYDKITNRYGFDLLLKAPFPGLVYSRTVFGEEAVCNAARVWCNRKNRRQRDEAWKGRDMISTEPPPVINPIKISVIQTETHIVVICVTVMNRKRWVKDGWVPPKYVPPFTMEGPMIDAYEYSKEVEARKQREAAELALGIDPASRNEPELL